MSRIIEPFKQFFDGAGNPLIAGWLAFYQSGSNNIDKTTYSDSNESSPNPNPIQLDSEGRCPDIFGTGSYRVVSYSNDTLLNAPLEQIQVKDPVGGSAGTADFSDWSAGTLYDLGSIVKANDNNYYESLFANNENNDPTTTPAAWKQTAFLQIWNETIDYAVGDRVTDTIDGFDYISKVTPNLNQQPSTSSTYWDNFAVKASVSGVAAEGDTQVARVITEGDTQVARVITEGDTQIALVENEGDDQIQRVIDMTASDLLTSIKTVDGTGSGLDADLLDGNDSDSDATADTIVLRDSNGFIYVSQINFSNLESATAFNGGVAFDSSEGLLIYRATITGDATSGASNYLILDRSNIIGGDDLTITGGESSAGAPVTFDVDSDVNATASTIAKRDTSGNITANAFNGIATQARYS